MIILCMYVRSLPAAAKASQPPNPIVTRKDASRPPHKDGALILCSVRTVQYSTVQFCAAGKGPVGHGLHRPEPDGDLARPVTSAKE